MALPYDKLLEAIEQDLREVGIFNDIRVTFKRWINNQTRLNETNMNELVTFIQTYAKEVGYTLDRTLDNNLKNLINTMAGWKNVDEHGEPNGGELLGDYSNNKALGQNSLVGGSNNISNETANNSTVFGSNNAANNDHTLLVGKGLKDASSGQVIFGQYNIADEANVFEIGNGTSDDSRQNIFEIDNSGRVSTPKDNLDETEDPKVLTPKGYVDAAIDRLDKNVWLGSVKISEVDFDDEEKRTQILNNAVKLYTKDVQGYPDGRDPRNGDQLTLIIGAKSQEEPPYEELWMFSVPDLNDPETPSPGHWEYFSSLQKIVDATKSIKGLVKVGTNITVSKGVISVNTADESKLGLVQVGDNINVDSNGVISVPATTIDTLGVVKLGSVVKNNADGQLAIAWNDW